MSLNTSIRRHVRALAFIALACLLVATAKANETDVKRVWQMLDYLAVDYAGAVKDGAVVSQSEFDEMREFAKTSQAKLAALEPKPEREALVAEAGALAAAIEGKKNPDQVAALAKSLAQFTLQLS